MRQLHMRQLHMVVEASRTPVIKKLAKAKLRTQASGKVEWPSLTVAGLNAAGSCKQCKSSITLKACMRTYSTWYRPHHCTLQTHYESVRSILAVVKLIVP